MTVALLDGYEFDHSSAVIRVLGLKLDGCEDFSFGFKTDEKILYGTSSKPIARTRGQVKFESWKLTMFRSTFQKLISLPAFQLGITAPIFPMVVEEKEVGGGVRLAITTLKSARILGAVETSKQGGDATMVAVEGSCLDMEFELGRQPLVSLGL